MSSGDGPKASAADIKRYRENYQGEIDGVEMYRRLARAEKDQARAEIFLELAETETKHVRRWDDKLREAGVEPGDIAPSLVSGSSASSPTGSVRAPCCP